METNEGKEIRTKKVDIRQ